MHPIVSLLLSWLTGPLTKTVGDLLTRQMKGSLSQAEIEAEVRKAVLASLASLNAQQIDLLKAEIQSDDPWVRRWRPTVALSFAGILMWYAVGVPVAVDWFGMPPLRVGDKLLEWIFTLLGGCLGTFAIGRTLEKIVATWRR